MGQAQSKSQDANISHARKLQIFKILNTCNVTSGVDKQAVSYLSIPIQSVEFFSKIKCLWVGHLEECERSLITRHTRLEGHARRPESEGRRFSLCCGIVRHFLGLSDNNLTFSYFHFHFLNFYEFSFETTFALHGIIGDFN